MDDKRKVGRKECMFDESDSEDDDTHHRIAHSCEDDDKRSCEQENYDEGKSLRSSSNDEQDLCRFEDLFIFPIYTLKALVLYYDSDQYVEKIGNIHPKWHYKTCQEKDKEILILLNRLWNLIQSQKVRQCITTILKIYYSADNVSKTKYIIPLCDAICNLRTFVTKTLPFYFDKAKYIYGKNPDKDDPYTSIFLMRNNGQMSKSQSAITQGYHRLYKEIKLRISILSQLVKDITLESSHSFTVNYPLWLPKCIALISNERVCELLSHTCFHLFRNIHHAQTDYDVSRSLILVSSIDCFISQNDDDICRFKSIVDALNNCLYSMIFSVFSERDPLVHHDSLPHSMMSTDMNRARLPLDMASLDMQDTESCMPHIYALENLLTPSTWESIERQTIPNNIDKMVRLTKDLCKWGNKQNKNGKILDSKLKNRIKQEISLMGSESILKRAMSIASAYEVMRCFHLSPVIVNHDCVGDIDLRSKGKETAKACILLIMISLVRNVIFSKPEETNCDTVIITSRARDSYVKRQNNLHIEFESSSCIVIDKDCFGDVMTAIQKKEDILLC